MADEIIVETTSQEVIEVGVPGPQGATGANGTNGTNGQGVPVGGTTGQVLRKVSSTNYDTEWGTGGGSVTFGTTAGTACEGNDSRIANIPNGTGSIALGQSGTRTTLNGAASGSDKTITLPNATGTLALTQQATDYEVTDETKGVIMKSPNGTRWRVTIDNNGSLLRTTLATLILSALMLCGTRAQVRDLVYGTNNVVVGPTNEIALSFTNSVAFSNPITFGTNAATTRTNLGLGNIVENSINTTDNGGSINTSDTGGSINTSDQGGSITTGPRGGSINTSGSGAFNGGSINLASDANAFAGSINMSSSDTNEGGSLNTYGAGSAGGSINTWGGGGSINTRGTGTLELGVSGTRTTIVGSATTNRSISLPNASGTIALANTPVPSGAATTNSILTADGAGGSSFVVSRTVTRFTTNDQTKTNWVFNQGNQATNNDPQMGSISLDANSFYRVEYAVAWVATTNSGFNHGFAFSTNLSEFSQRSGVGQSANTTITAINVGTNGTTISLPAGTAAATGGRYAGGGFIYLLTSSNANTMTYRWYPINNSADATTLVRSSMLSVTKMSP
jgi:hypothetical protein